MNQTSATRSFNPSQKASNANSNSTQKQQVSKIETTQSNPREESLEMKNLLIDFHDPQLVARSVRFPNNGRSKKINKPKPHPTNNKVASNPVSSHLVAPKTYPKCQLAHPYLKNGLHSHKHPFYENSVRFSAEQWMNQSNDSDLDVSYLTETPQNKPNAFTCTQLNEMLHCFNFLSFQSGVDPEYLTATQPEITQKSRALLINWLLLVHQKLSLHPQTFFTAINVLDKYCSKVPVQNKKWQLLGVTILFMAAKFEEVRPPKISKWVSISEKQFSVLEIITLEAEVLCAIDFRLSTSSPYQLLELAVEIQGLSSAVFQTALGFLMASCFDLRMSVFDPRLTVEASLALAQQTPQDSALQSVDQLSALCARLSSNFTLAGDDQNKCMRNMCLIVLNLNKAGLLALRKVFSSL